jgi:DNA primase
LAPNIPEETINEIRNAGSIVDIIGEFVALKKAGQNWVGLCPFHAEKTPSFTVTPQKDMYYCFGCGEGGNIFSFLMKQQGISFPEAVKQLADRYGVRLPEKRISPQEMKNLAKREKMFALNRLALRFYRHVLVKDALGGVARGYLDRRGIQAETREIFQLGFAPAGWDHLVRYLRHQGAPLELAAQIGLVAPRKDGAGYYDRLRDRIVFPITDPGGQVIGFGGRVLDDALPKYINSPESSLYAKGRCLYGLEIARKHCRNAEQVYIVEGYFDVIALHQSGIRQTVGTLGTALTEDHIKLIRGLVGATGKAILVFDSDEAGMKAAKRSVALFEKGLVEFRVLVLPPGEDPDSFVRARGSQAFQALAQNAQTAVPFLTEMAITQYGLSLEGRIRVLSEVGPPLGAMTDPGARAVYVKYLAERLDIDEAAVLAKVAQATPHGTAASDAGSGRSSARPPQQSPRKPQSSRIRVEQAVVAMMLQYPPILPAIHEHRVIEALEDPLLKAIAQEILGEGAKTSDVPNDPEAKTRMVAALTARRERWDPKRCRDIIWQLLAPLIRRREKQLAQRIKTAEAAHDETLLGQLLKERARLAKMRSDLQIRVGATGRV